MELSQLKENYKETVELLENDEGDAAELLSNLQIQIEEAFHEVFTEDDIEDLERIEKEFKVLYQKFHPFPYNEEDELDRMFPERHDENFDSDNMNFRGDD